MQNITRYTIFNTKWGYFGLAGTELGLLRTHLPGPRPEKIMSGLLKNLPPARHDKGLFKTTRERVIAYFEGASVDFNYEIPIILDGLSEFAVSVLAACRDIKFGVTKSYSELAKNIGRPSAARAIGNALAKNPLPLIIPCHRAICSDGKIGGFSAPGGKNLKAKLLKHEKQVIRL